MKKTLLFILMLLLTVGLLLSCKSDSSDDDVTDDQNQGGANSSSVVWSSDVTPTIIDMQDDVFGLADSIVLHIKQETGKVPVKSSAVSGDKGNLILLGETGNALSTDAYRRFSSYVNVDNLFDNGQSAWLIYVKDGSVAVAYSDILSKKAAIDYLLANADGASFAPANGVLAKDTIEISEYLKELREAEQAQIMGEIGEMLGSAALANFKKLYSIFDEDLYIWLANLWCPDNGGFYYSISARNNEGFLPDLESTCQTLNTLDRSGLTAAYGKDWAQMLPEEIKTKLLNFAREMQAEDRYFYHPQWGTGIGTSRQGRDAGWARRIIEGLGGTPKYPYITEADESISASYLTSSFKVDSKALAVSKVVATAAKDDVYKSKEAFIAYLDSLKFNENSYSAGNTINSTTGVIKKHGLWQTLRDYLTEKQNPENGLWEEEVTYQSVNGLMKLCTCFGSSYPNADKALDSAIEILLKPIDDDLTGITYVYNPWVAIANLLNAVTTERALELRKMLYKNAENIFAMTIEKLSAFAKEDGGFSYLRDYSSPFSQDVPVAVSGSAESDVNATSIAISTVVIYMSEVFDLKFPTIYSKYESAYFLDTLTGLGSIIKDSSLSTPPEVITFDDYIAEDSRIDANVVIDPATGVLNNIGDAEMDLSGYKWFESKVVPNPTPGADPKDLVLYVADKTNPSVGEDEKSYADAQSSTSFEILNIGASGNCYIFEADILFDGTNDAAAPVMQLMFYRNNTSLVSAWVNIYQYERFGKKFLRIAENWAGDDGIKDKEVVSGIPVDEWFKLRVEMYKDYSSEGGELKTMLKFFVNDVYAGTSDSGHYVSSAYKDFLVSAVKLAYYRQAASAFYLNNVYVAKSSKTYEMEKIDVSDTDTEVKDKQIWDFEDGIPGAPSNFTELFYKDEDTGITSVYADQWTEELEELYGEAKKTPGVKIYSAKDPQNSANKVLKAYAFNTKSASYTATMYVDDVLTEEGGKTIEVEFDYFFDKISWLYSSDFFSVNLQNAAGTSVAGLTFEGLGWEEAHSTELLGIKFSNGTRLTNFALADATWYTLKLVYHFNEENPADSKLLLYVKTTEGYACLANTTLPAKLDKIERVGFTFYSYDIRGTQYIDNVSVSKTALEYNYEETPIEGEIVIPQGEDTKIYIDTSSRGEGYELEKAEKFESVSFDSLVSGGKMAVNQKRGDGIGDGARTLSFVNVGGSGALIYESLESGNYALNFVSSNYAYEGFVFETDIKLKDVDSEEGRDIRFTGTASNGLADSALYGFNVKFHKNPKDSVGGYIVTINGDDQKNVETDDVSAQQKVVIKEDTWVNIRLVAYGLDQGDKLELYVNKKHVISAKLNASIDGIMGVELFTPSTYGGHGWEQGAVYIDNLYASGTGAAPEREFINQSIRYNGLNKQEAFSYTGMTYDQLVSDRKMAVNAARGDGLSDGYRTLAFSEIDGDTALVYSALGSANKAINFISQSPALSGFVFETDLMLDGIKAEKNREIRFVGTATNGAKEANLWALNIKISAHYLAEIDGYLVTVGGVEDFEFIISDKTWVNISFVAYGLEKGANATITINSVMKSFELTSSLKAIRGVELYTASDNNGLAGFTEGSIYLDNTYVSGTGNYTPPTPITTTQRGEGVDKDKAITYEGLTYADLISSGKMVANTKRTDGVDAGKRTVSLSQIDENAALVFKSLGSAIHCLNFVMDGKAEAGIVFETDIMLDGVDAFKDRDVRFTGTASNGTADANIWAVNIKFCANPDVTSNGYVLTVNGAEYSGVFPDKTWINVRFVTKGVAKGDEFDLYVNGEKVATGTLSASISGMKGIELYTASTLEGSLGFTQGSVYIDNTVIYGIAKADTPDVPDTGSDENKNDTMTGDNIDPPAWVENKRP